MSGAIVVLSLYGLISWTGTSLSIEQGKNKDLIISEKSA
jgi:hypothetical protein